jgi:ABC-type phosphate transport system substrate-binding protein
LRRPRLLRLAALAAAAFTAFPPEPASAATAFRVIVHPQVKGNEIPRAALSAIFLKQASKWGDGQPAAPVDQSVQSPVRRAFSFDVLKQSLVQVQVYWQRRITAGQVPPPVKPSDEEVVAFVASTAGGIGYVSPATALPGTVREIAVID